MYSRFAKLIFLLQLVNHFPIHLQIDHRIPMYIFLSHVLYCSSILPRIYLHLANDMYPDHVDNLQAIHRNKNYHLTTLLYLFQSSYCHSNHLRNDRHWPMYRHHVPVLHRPGNFLHTSLRSSISGFQIHFSCFLTKTLCRNLQRSTGTFLAHYVDLLPNRQCIGPLYPIAYSLPV